MANSRDHNSHVYTSIHFLTPDSLYVQEKPYAFRYPIDDCRQTNMVMQPIAHIKIDNLRGQEHDFTFEKDGFTVAKLAQEPVYDDFFTEDGLHAYFRVIETLLKSLLGANEVHVFRHGIRKRHIDFPVSTGESYEYDQPTSVAHVDTTLEETKMEIRRQYGVGADRYLAKSRYQWINVWKPLKGPLSDWPLTYCSSANLEMQDFESADLLYPDLATENYQIYHNARYRWFYLDAQTTSEVIVFKQSDSKPGACLGVPHCSFANPLASTEEVPRESIEVRALAFYD